MATLGPVVGMDSATHLAQLVDALSGDVVRRHHADERRDLPDLVDRLAALTAAPGQPDVLLPVLAAVRALRDLLQAHLDKEEHILFPAFAALGAAARQGLERPPLPFPSVLHPIRVMEADHRRLDAAVTDVRAQAAQVAVPPDLRGGWMEWRRALDRFAEELAAHLAIENEVLFPRALELERALG